MAKDSAKLHIGDETYDLPIHTGTIGPDVLDITKLYKETDRFTFDPGFTSTAACESGMAVPRACSSMARRTRG